MELDRLLLLAHERKDHQALVELYMKAGEEKLTHGDIDAGCFFLTHAYIFALETDHQSTGFLRRRLAEFDREN